MLLKPCLNNGQVNIKKDVFFYIVCIYLQIIEHEALKEELGREFLAAL
jgi:hypothetical protein